MGARISILESPFLVTPVSFFFFFFFEMPLSGSHEISLGEFAFLWLLLNLSETCTAGPDRPAVTVFIVLS